MGKDFFESAVGSGVVEFGIIVRSGFNGMHDPGGEFTAQPPCPRNGRKILGLLKRLVTPPP